MKKDAPYTIPTSTTAIVHVNRLRSNVQAIRRRLGGVGLMGVVKANAYGHGSVAVARVLEEMGVTSLAVATVSEGIELRRHGISADIVVFAPPVPDRAPLYAEYDLQASIDSPSSLDALRTAGGRIPCHLKVDTGMSRLGVAPTEAADLIRRVEQSANAQLASIWTHFSRADEPDSDFTAVQFDRLVKLSTSMGGAPAPLHCAASAAMYTFPDSIDPSHMSLARIGIALYGLLDLPGLRPPPDLQPVMEFTSRISALRTLPEGAPVSYGGRWTAPTARRIATVAAGYADGVSRALSNKGRVRIQGNTYPIAGTVCMDMFMVDLGPPDEADGSIRVGDEVTIFGIHPPTCFDVADLCGSITYEQVCGISSRVQRVYPTEFNT